MRIEDAEIVEVGKRYDVPCVASIPWEMWVPVMGPLHEDRDLLKFPDDHWHVDWRFVPQRFIDEHDGFRYRYFALPISEKNTNGLVMRKIRTCKREFGIFPDALCKILEPVYMSARLKNNICPHRGFSCKAMPIDDKGCVVCPGHGLQFNVATGEMVPRRGPVQGKLIR